MAVQTAAGEEASILLIDDSTVDLRVLVDTLSDFGLRVYLAFDGLEGYRRAELVLPSLILLDIGMPGLDGFGTCRRLKSNPRTRDIPVIFLSSATERERRLEGLELGAVDYIAKPFDEAEVLARVRIHLDIARRLRGAAPDDAGAEPERPAGLSRRDATLVEGATAILRRAIGAPPSPDAAARMLGTNEKRLNEAFHAAFGVPVFAWLREERLRLARELLVETETPIAEIAAHLGYSNQANFSRAFRQRYGCAPIRLRNGGAPMPDASSDTAEPPGPPAVP
ncbi:response regulator transcription factor [Prosthecomicrobium pneumaticum]|uniref:DNA-binding response OmpR family regulator n=1 Tax=Prosthecomicrobium pneumaticum TaxID=81895 RepID=A0A7W9FLI4_9HYPH|nr:helix-turn-helix domain-containing protein [Prosthecomicrobium pneumaticum]MBB5752864.1 DNA-binding response OmpR family regulator [Prosthecomicrobium pneumaticum]